MLTYVIYDIDSTLNVFFFIKYSRFFVYKLKIIGEEVL